MRLETIEMTLSNKCDCNRQADEMFIRAVLECDCLDNIQLRILSELADKMLSQAQVRRANGS